MKFTSTTKSLLLTLLCSLSQIAFCDLAKMEAVIATPSFLYYLNPNPLDRNLEWDGVTNLFPGPRVEAWR